MKICRVCKTENEEHFVYCKNCGTQFEQPSFIKQDNTYQNNAYAQYTAPTQNAASSHMPYSPYQNPVQQNSAPASNALVPVLMQLPDPFDVTRLTVQTVYVTPMQYDALVRSGRLNGVGGAQK